MRQDYHLPTHQGKIVPLLALMLTFLVGMVAFSVDIGWIVLVRAQLQAAADSAALAGAGKMGSGQTAAKSEAKTFAGLNIAGGFSDSITLADSDIVFGSWNSTTRVFTAGSTSANAIQVTTRRTLPLFFGQVLGMKKRDIQATAIGLANPRDIAFIIDLSGSMNNDTEEWATQAINDKFPTYNNVGTQLMSDFFTDFGFGSYPGTVKHVGEGFIPSTQLTNNAYNYLISTYLKQSSIASTYKILSSDSAATKKIKAYKWIIDKQLAVIMPNAKPTPNTTTTNLNYWTAYLDYVILGDTVNNTYNGPDSQDYYRISNAANPYRDAWSTTDLPDANVPNLNNKLGYQTYAQFMLDYGRNLVVCQDSSGNDVYVPLSSNSPDCPWHNETVGSGTYSVTLSFPPREQPTHAVRRAVIAAINKIAEINSGLDGASKDHVGVISFDTASGCDIRYPLSLTDCDYAAAQTACRDMQAVGDNAYSTASENGLIMAKGHLDPNANPAYARKSSNKVLIFLSDGIPNIMQSTSTTISNYTKANTLGEWFTSGNFMDERNATLMQIDQIQALGWQTYAVGVGLAADRTLMDRMARMAGSAVTDPNNPTGPKISPYADGNPADYETRLTNIFTNIVGSPNVKLVR